MIRRLFPSPLMSASVAAFWLALNDSLHPAHLALALLLAVCLPLIGARVVEHRPRLRAPGAALALAAVVAWDVIRSNIEVALLILGPQQRIQSRFIHVPCALEDPCATVVLAGIITMTPGTLSVDISEDRRTIIIHSLHAPDPQQIVDSIRARYERPLAEIFSCSIKPS